MGDVAGLQKIINDIEAEMDSFLKSKNLTIERLKKNKGFHDAIAAELACTGRPVPTKLDKKGEEIPATAKKDAAMQELVRDGDPIVTMLAQGRVQAKSNDQVIAKIQAMIRLAKINDGFVPVYMRCGGAHTLHFAGGQQINWQNFGHKGVWNRVRGCIHAAPGDKLVSGDLGQIEARVLVTLAGQQDMVEAFRNKRDIYSELAAKIFNEEVRKPGEFDPPEKADRLDSLRQIGKGAILGLGYQTGKKKFWVQQASEPKVAPLIAAGLFTRATAAATVNAYRQDNPKVVQFWNDCDAAAKNAIVYNHTSMVGRCLFTFANGALLITLPSGRTMRYARARLVDRTGEIISYMDDEGEDAEFETDGPGIVYGTRMDNGKDVGIHLYGGKIVENIVQAAARDIMVEMMLQRGLIATPKVTALLPRVRAVLTMADELYGNERPLDLATLSRKVVIASTNYFETRSVADLIIRAQAKAPGLQFETRTLSGGFPNHELESGEFDLAIAAYFDALPSGYRIKTVFRDRFVSIQSRANPYAKSKRTLNAYLNCRHLQIEVPAGVFAPVDHYLQRKKQRRNIALRIGNFLTPPGILNKSDFVLTCPLSLAENYREMYPLVISELPFELPAIDTKMVWHQKNQNDPFHVWLRGCVAGT